MKSTTYNLEHTTFDIPCVILSGGKSSRMGEDKSLLPFKEFNTLIEYQYNKFSKIFKDVYISSKIDKFDFKAKIIFDKNEIFSPMIALKSIFESLENKHIFISTVDTPFIKEDTIKSILENKNSHDIVIAKDQIKSHYLCGLFSRDILKTIDRLILQDIHKMKKLFDNTNSRELFFKDNGQFLNINTKEDYKLSLSTIV